VHISRGSREFVRAGTNAIAGCKSGRNSDPLTIRADLPGIIERGYKSMTGTETGESVVVEEATMIENPPEVAAES
jgi:hypothetical protein